MQKEKLKIYSSCKNSELMSEIQTDMNFTMTLTKLIFRCYCFATIESASVLNFISIIKDFFYSCCYLIFPNNCILLCCSPLRHCLIYVVYPTSLGFFCGPCIHRIPCCYFSYPYICISCSYVIDFLTDYAAPFIT